MKKVPILITLAVLALLASCSSTGSLPDDELLYTGIGKISYTRAAGHRGGADSVGVITSIAQAAQKVDSLLTHKSNHPLAVPAEGLAPQSAPTAAEREAARERRRTEKRAFSDAQTEVYAVLAYAPNYALFGSSTYRSFFRPGLWFYNGFVHARSGVGKWIFKNFASTPVLVSTVNPSLRAKVAANTLHNYGYFNGSVDFEIDSARHGRSAKVNYYVTPRTLYTLDSISYLHFPPQADSLLRATAGERKLRRGDPFQVVNLDAEQKRLETLFRNHGYYYYQAAYATFRADTFARSGRVQLQVVPVGGIPPEAGRRWYIGRTRVFMSQTMRDSLDSCVSLRDHEFHFHGKRMPVRPGVWLRTVLMRRGAPYNQELAKLSVEKLSEMGIFSQMDVSYTPRDSSATCDTLDVNVFTQLDKPWSSEFAMDVTSKSNDQLGPGLSLTLTKKNAFAGGEDLALRLYGSYEWQAGSSSRRDNNDLLNSYELGASLDLKFPRVMLPLVSSRRFRFPASTTFSLSGDWNERAHYFNLVTFGAGVTYKWRRTATSQHELSPFGLDYTQLVNTTHGFDSIMNVNPALYVSMRDRFIPAVSYTYTYASPATARNPLWWQVSVKEAGNLTSVGFALGGKHFNQKDKRLFGTPFAQFLKLTTELHKTFALTGKLALATRLMGGVCYSYGNSNSAPYKEQFYVGGANSVRAFTIRTAGPGRFYTTKSKYSYMDQTGDLKLEGNAELRFPVWGSLNGAVFLDAGNVWLLRADPQRPGGRIGDGNFFKSIALGTGAGLRYDLQFIVLRLDLGVALHNPYETSRRGYYNIPKFTDSLALHFAVGYPF